jgi:hypothetical protein
MICSNDRGFLTGVQALAGDAMLCGKDESAFSLLLSGKQIFIFMQR